MLSYASIILAGVLTVGSGPAMPYYSWKACPFECCTYGLWTARSPVGVYVNRSLSSKRVATIRKGETITAITGVVVTTKAGRVRILEPMVLDDKKRLRVKPGDELHTLHYLGEGYELFWYRGHTYAGELYADTMPPSGSDEPKGYSIVAAPQWEWWVKVRTKAGKVGWVFRGGDFNGSDACG